VLNERWVAEAMQAVFHTLHRTSGRAPTSTSNSRKCLLNIE
jgi:hypothetical protein